MKLAKKMLASVVALAMVAALAVTAFAAGATFTVSGPSTAEVGSTITVTLSGTGVAGLESGDIVINFTAGMLEYLGNNQDQVNNPDGAFVMAGCPADGELTCSFASSGSLATDCTFAQYSFKVLKAGEIEFNVTVEADGGDATGSSMKVTASEKVAETTTESPQVVETTTAAPEDGSKPVVAPSTDKEITKTGEASIAAIAGVMAIAAVAFVATRKKDEE